MTQLFDPKMDFIFKKIFGSDKHHNILISFLNAVMKPKDPIVTVEIKDPNVTQDMLDGKSSRLDVKATTNFGELINIEIQLKNEYNMVKRSLFYWSKMYSEQLGKGKNYDTLSKTVCINLLDFSYLKTDLYHSCFRLKEITTNEELTDVQEIHFIEFPKLPKDADIKDLLVAWMKFLIDPEDEEVRSLEFTKKEFREAKDELVRLSHDSDARAIYEAREKAEYDRISALETAKVESRLEGIEEGIEKGIEKGRLEGVIETAKSLIAQGININTIAIATKLSIAEIEKLK